MTVEAAPPPEPWTPARLAALDRIQRLRRDTADRTDRLAALITATADRNARRRYRPAPPEPRAGAVTWTALPADDRAGIRAFGCRILSPSYRLTGPHPGGWRLHRLRFTPGPPVALGSFPHWRLACRAAETDAGLRPGARHRFTRPEAGR